MDKLPLKKVEAYYEPSSRYWYKSPDTGQWIPLHKDDLRLFVEDAGYSAKPDKGKRYSPADREIAEIQLKNHICYAGPVASRQPGVYGTGAQKYLVTYGPTLVKPTKGDWPYIKEIGLRLLGKTQLEYMLGWMSEAVKTIYNQRTQQRPIVVLAGPAACGKSFWQSRVITPAFGGRAGRPMQFMSGKTHFNADLIECEHLLLEDDSSKTDIASRREFGAVVKTFVTLNEQRAHDKGKTAKRVDSQHWISVSLNDEPENLSILPLLDESIKDKISLLRCQKAISPEWPGIPNEKLQELVHSEIPAFVNYLLNEHVVPDDLKSLRYGVKVYHDPELLTAMHELSPEHELDHLIDYVFQGSKKDKIKIEIGYADLYVQLTDDGKVGKRAANILRSASSMSTYLGRLRDKFPQKYYHAPRVGRGSPRLWVLDWSKSTETED